MSLELKIKNLHLSCLESLNQTFFLSVGRSGHRSQLQIGFLCRTLIENRN